MYPSKYIVTQRVDYEAWQRDFSHHLWCPDFALDRRPPGGHLAGSCRQSPSTERRDAPCIENPDSPVRSAVSTQKTGVAEPSPSRMYCVRERRVQNAVRSKVHQRASVAVGGGAESGTRWAIEAPQCGVDRRFRNPPFTLGDHVVCCVSCLCLLYFPSCPRRMHRWKMGS